MKRFGSKTNEMKKMDENDIFLQRVNLLVVVVKAVMKGYPIGEYRKEAALDNAIILHKFTSKIDMSHLGTNNASHLFNERVKLLCVMSTAMLADKFPLGIHRREAILENIEGICEFAFPKQEFEAFHKILKVA